MRACNWCLALVLGVAACGEQAHHPVEDGMGPTPALPAPRTAMMPTVNVAPATGWSADGKPVAAAGLHVGKFADGLDHPRWLHVLPNGDVLVAETNAPDRPEDRKGIKGRVMSLMMKRAGAGVPSANRIALLRDTDADGIADHRAVFLDDVNSPFGMALVGNSFYVANTDAVIEYRYAPGEDRIAGAGRRLAELPAGPRNHHWTKSLIASPDGTQLYVGVGSNSNIAEHGLEAEAQRAAVLRIEIESGASSVYASGLRNPVGMAWEPQTAALWVAVNERDELRSDLVPDYLTSIR